ncbi:DUF3313 family protein [Rhizobium sp. CRIBSB]|nr:DUF3313 family protein [Rhizobium sp. CRIBSB]
MQRDVSRFGLGAAMLALSLLGGCATTTPKPENLASSPLLQPTHLSDQPYTYRNPTVDFSAYDSVVVAPVKLASPRSPSEAGLAQDEMAELAGILRQQFAASLSSRFPIVSIPGPRSLLVELTLIEAEKSKPVLSTVSHVMPVGIAVNAGAQLAGRQGTFSGSVLYAVEVRAAGNSRILYAEVARRSADALDLTASLAPLAAAKAGIRNGAREFPEDLMGTKSR